MIRPGGPNPFAEEIHVAFNQAALGDSISTLPALVYALKNYHTTVFNIWPPDYQASLVAHALSPYPNARVRPASKINTEADKELPAAFNKFLNSYTTLKTELVPYTFRALLDHDPPSPVDMEYVQVTPKSEVISQAKNLLGGIEKYVVVTLNYTSETRRFLPKVANPVIDFIVAKEYTPVFLGSAKAPVNGGEAIQSHTTGADLSKGLSLLDRTSLEEAQAILGGATAVVGVDNGLLHLAATSQVPIVAGFTNVDPKTREPYRNGVKGWKWHNVVPTNELACRYCQSRWHLCYKVKFTECWYKDYQCLDLNPDEFIFYLRQYLV